MELATVGAVLTYAIKVEDQSGAFYEQAASVTEATPTGEVFLSLAAARRKRQKVVERSRREFVNEMLLEPLEGLEGSDGLFDITAPEEPNSAALLDLAEELEEGGQRQYGDIAAKISHLPQLARVFRKLGEGNAKHRSELESLRG
jgi:rubrerythrin